MDGQIDIWMNGDRDEERKAERERGTAALCNVRLSSLEEAETESIKSFKTFR